MATWTNWSRLSTAHPAQEVSPHDAGEVVDAVVAARHQNLTVKMPGTGHSFTDIAAHRRAAAAPRQPARRRRRRPRRDDRHRAGRHAAARAQPRARRSSACRCTTWATSTSRPSPARSPPAPTAPAASVASLSAQVAGLELVTGDGRAAARRRRRRTPTCSTSPGSASARSGILTSVTFDVEPLFTLEAHEAPMRWDEALDRFDELAADNHHFEMYWFPHTDRLLTKRNNRTLDAGRAARPGSERWLDDEFLSNRVFGWVNRLGNRRPGAGPADQRPLRPGAERAPLLRRAAQGVHLRRAGWCSGRWSTPSRARSALRRCARCARSIDASGLDGSASRSRSGSARPTTCRCPRRTSATRSTSPST